jgi:hypothetical protein
VSLRRSKRALAPGPLSKTSGAGARRKAPLTAEAAPTRWERLREHLWAAQRVLEEDPVADGFDTDWAPSIMRQVLGAVVDAAGLRWRVPMSDRRYLDEEAIKKYGLSGALLRLTAEALRNDSKTDDGKSGGALALELWNIVRAIERAHASGDLRALREGASKQQGRDAPAKWATNYLRARGAYPRKLDDGERKELLIECFDASYYQKNLATEEWIPFMVTDAIMRDCVSARGTDGRADLVGKLRREFAKGPPATARDLVERLLRLAGERDPLNTLDKRERRRDRKP